MLTPRKSDYFLIKKTRGSVWPQLLWQNMTGATVFSLTRNEGILADLYRTYKHPIVEALVSSADS